MNSLSLSPQLHPFALFPVLLPFPPPKEHHVLLLHFIICHLHQSHYGRMRGEDYRAASDATASGQSGVKRGQVETDEDASKGSWR